MTTGAGSGSISGSGVGAGITSSTGATGSGSGIDPALGSKAGASLRAMALPGAKACTFSNNSAGKVGMPGSGCSNKISTARP